MNVKDAQLLLPTFKSYYKLIATWEDNSIEEDIFDPDKYWIPSIFIENTIGSIQEKIDYKITNKGKRKFVSEIRKIKGLFYETLGKFKF